MPELSQRIVGTWELVQCVARTPDGQESFPSGEDFRGILCYSPDGYVSVNLMRPGRPLLSPGKAMRTAPDSEIAAISRGYMAYAGPYRVDEAAGVIHHTFELCLEPGWIHSPQVRHAKFIGDQLELSVPAPPDRPNGRSVHLLWRRAPAAA